MKKIILPLILISAICFCGISKQTVKYSATPNVIVAKVTNYTENNFSKKTKSWPIDPVDYCQYILGNKIFNLNNNPIGFGLTRQFNNINNILLNKGYRIQKDGNMIETTSYMVNDLLTSLEDYAMVGATLYSALNDNNNALYNNLVNYSQVQLGGYNSFYYGLKSGSSLATIKDSEYMKTVFNNEFSNFVPSFAMKYKSGSYVTTIAKTLLYPNARYKSHRLGMDLGELSVNFLNYTATYNINLMLDPASGTSSGIQNVIISPNSVIPNT